MNRGSRESRVDWSAVGVIALGLVVLAGAVLVIQSVPSGAERSADRSGYVSHYTPAAEPTATKPELPAGRMVLRDDFERDAAGLGAAPTGQPWGVSGTAALRVRDGRMVAPANSGSGYAQVDLGDRPSMLRVTGSWDQASGTGTRSGVTLIASRDADYSLRHMVHFNLRPDGWAFQLGGKDHLETVASGALDLSTNGTPYTWAMYLDGDTAILTLPDGDTQSVTDPRIRSLAGRFCIYEISSYAGEADSRVDSASAAVSR